jgi:hypothetical protein
MSLVLTRMTIARIQLTAAAVLMVMMLAAFNLNERE